VGADPDVTVLDNRLPKPSNPYASPQPLPAAEISRFSESYWYAMVSPLSALYAEPILPLLESQRLSA
jgi:hypothetical protein